MAQLVVMLIVTVLVISVMCCPIREEKKLSAERSLLVLMLVIVAVTLALRIYVEGTVSFLIIGAVVLSAITYPLICWVKKKR